MKGRVGARERRRIGAKKREREREKEASWWLEASNVGMVLGNTGSKFKAGRSRALRNYGPEAGHRACATR